MPEPEGGSMSSCSPLYTGHSTSTNELLIILGKEMVYICYIHIIFPLPCVAGLILRSGNGLAGNLQTPVQAVLLTMLYYTIHNVECLKE